MPLSFHRRPLRYGAMLVVLLTASVNVRAESPTATVMAVDTQKDLFTISHLPEYKWQLKDRACFTRRGQLRCGTVVMTTPRTATLKLDKLSSARTPAGDKGKAFAPAPGDRVTRSPSSVGSAASAGESAVTTKLPPPTGWQFPLFQVTPLSVIQSLGQRAYAVEVAWTPHYRFSPAFGLRPRVGLFVIERGVGGYAPCVDLAVLASVWPGTRFFFEAGPGTQVWIAYGGARATLSAGVGYAVRWSLPLGMELTHVSAGYTALFATPLVHQPRFSIGIGL